MNYIKTTLVGVSNRTTNRISKLKLYQQLSRTQALDLIVNKLFKNMFKIIREI